MVLTDVVVDNDVANMFKMLGDFIELRGIEASVIAQRVTEDGELVPVIQIAKVEGAKVTLHGPQKRNIFPPVNGRNKVLAGSR